MSILKYITLIALACSTSSCVSPSVTTITVRDSQGKPRSDFPLKIELSKGMKASDGMMKLRGDLSTFSDQNNPPEIINLKTEANGEAKIAYFFNSEQPSKLKSFLGASKIPDQSISVTPLKQLPKGSKIKISFPNP